MAGVASPLQYGDPPRLGQFVLQARLRIGPAGLVYLGQDSGGRAVSLAVLTRGAAQDPAARDRFVTAIREAAASRGVRGWMARAARGRTAVTEAVPQVLAMDGGAAPWVATPYEPDRAGAERFLEPVLVRGTLIGERHGPDFAPHWVGDRSPALPPPSRGAPPAVETLRTVVLAGAVLSVLLVLLAAMLWQSFRPEDEVERFPAPLPPTRFEPTPPPVPTTPEPGRPSPSPSESGTGPGEPGDEEGPEDPRGGI
ncbi:hypothetical protein [Planomonospora parontospora]|uniref:hypothetical protein n=1 Tax=Planomonospora parontospora TaxID=58119 RepID=UPI0016700EA2|nr:hypothetical protein [Planomonospora parontospora]GGL51315.1 hypothetical protein GCM10014719_60750 [Planomonospora parontospora subsp. antibiotica]GII19092.1 hypothetical protein Ppa05_58180 [Planomonospora parontospora subsp. antibiotica]